jgi:hypothetical protein
MDLLNSECGNKRETSHPRPIKGVKTRACDSNSDRRAADEIAEPKREALHSNDSHASVR